MKKLKTEKIREFNGWIQYKMSILEEQKEQTRPSTITSICNPSIWEAEDFK